MAYPPGRVLECARSIRPYLASLIGPVDAEIMDKRLAELISHVQGGADVTADILAVLSSRSEVRQRAHQYLELGAILAPMRGFEEFPGPRQTPVSASRFECPEGDFVWYRPFFGVPVPECPTHKKALKQA